MESDEYLAVIGRCSFLGPSKSEERLLNDSREKLLEEDTRQELTQKVLLSFARQIAIGMVTKFFGV